LVSGNKHIVLFVMLMEGCREEQIVVVLTYELGEWKL
jgi:hypothetical protein